MVPCVELDSMVRVRKGVESVIISYKMLWFLLRDKQFVRLAKMIGCFVHCYTVDKGVARATVIKILKVASKIRLLLTRREFSAAHPELIPYVQAYSAAMCQTLEQLCDGTFPFPNDYLEEGIARMHDCVMRSIQGFVSERTMVSVTDVSLILGSNGYMNFMRKMCKNNPFIVQELIRQCRVVIRGTY